MNNENVKEKLISAAKAEFLEKGYEKASLRSICSAAGVTTGALYFFFRNKEDLFMSIVSEKAEHMLAFVKRQTDSEVNGVGDSAEHQRELNRYICENKDVVRILLECAKGTPFESFREEYCAEVAKGFYMFYDKSGGAAEYREIMGLLVKMRIQGYIEMIKGDYDMDKMMKLSVLMETYGDYGFGGMMKEFKGIIEGTV